MSGGEGITVDVILPMEKAGSERVRRAAVARKLGISPSRIKDVRLVKESIDSRQKKILFQLRLLVGVDSPLPPERLPSRDYPSVRPGSLVALIVGFGPAGMFAALRCLELGMKPVVLERGKDVSSRRFDLAPILRRGTVMEDSNYCFGEGGAGTFSDGKLFTRATKRGPVREVYEIFVAHGAPREILTDAHPHIGSNLLPNVVKAIRESILRAGGEIHFNARVEHLLRSADGRRIRGVACADGREFAADSVLLATGHSARDVYRMMLAEGLALEQKSFAVGVRIEHPQAFVDARQYHLNPEQRRPEQLPAARYSVTTTIQDRGVHSFCMCPGGFIIPAATGPGQLVVNGMSPASRGTKWANSGMVVEVLPEDLTDYEAYGDLKVMRFQEEIERRFFDEADGSQNAPAQRMHDFVNSRPSSSLPPTSYAPGIHPARIDKLLPPFIARRLQKGFTEFGRKSRGFLTNEAVLIGAETRTSSPVRIPRDSETLSHITLSGLYPCGEGAGYAGGIVSAAIDGIRCADAVNRYINNTQNTSN